MKFLFVTDSWYSIGPDGGRYDLAEHAIEYMLRLLPEVTEFVLWGRYIAAEDVRGYYRFPTEVGACRVRFAGPVLERRGRAQWPRLILNNFRLLRRETRDADIVLLKMPVFFGMLAYHFVRRSQILVVYMVGDPAEVIPLAVPRARRIAPLVAAYCRKLLRRADLGAFVSRALLERYGADCRNPMVSNDCRFTREVIVPARAPEVSFPARVMYLGRLSPEKGLTVLLRAIQIVSGRLDVRLHIVGGGPLRAALEQLARELNIADRITWHGRVPAGKPLYDVLARGDTFVLPSFSEGMPSVIPEAMSQGLPIVATRVGGIPEVLLDGEAGLLVRPGEPEALAEAIERSLTDLDLRRRLISMSLRQAHANCIDNQTGRMIAAIADLIRERKQRCVSPSSA